MQIDAKTALVVIDTQIGFNDAKWGERNNPQAESNIARLLAEWRNAELPIFHVHHDSSSPTGLFRRGTPGSAAKVEAVPWDGEPIYYKTVHSALIGTELEQDLRANEITSLVIAGLVTNHCISTTARMAGNLGFKTFVVSDATAAFEKAHVDGSRRSPEEVHRAALSDLNGDFATIIETDKVLAAIPRDASVVV